MCTGTYNGSAEEINMFEYPTEPEEQWFLTENVWTSSNAVIKLSKLVPTELSLRGLMINKFSSFSFLNCGDNGTC